MNLHEYICHKRVRAGRITAVRVHDSIIIVQQTDGTEGSVHNPGLFGRYIPQPDDYLVVYADGYMSVSPKAPFEEGYARADRAGVVLGDEGAFGQAVRDGIATADAGDFAPRKVMVGDIVHFRLPPTMQNEGCVRPAIITRVWQQLDYQRHPGMSNIRVFLDGCNDADPLSSSYRESWGSIIYSEEPIPGTWCWPR